MKVVKVIEEIHHGGFGIIHKVETDDGSILARKTFSPQVPKNFTASEFSKLKRRFSREVKIQERLPQDLFIPIIFSSLDEDIPWFLMPLADESYDKEIVRAKSEKRIPTGLSDILNSLEYLHKLGLVHRDLKPGNVLFQEGRWKLADMGLITSDETLTSSFQTSDGAYAGSRDYMAPEQVTNFSGVTHHADIYSFGAILHDIFNGRPRIPFKKLTGNGTIGWIISKCTEEAVAKRFNDVKTLRDVLLTQLTKEEKVISASEDAEQWVKKLGNIDSFSADDLDSLIIYLESAKEAHGIIFMEVTTDLIEKLAEIDRELWKQFLLMYFEWVYNKSFPFDYCDVVVGHLFKAFAITTDLEIKAHAALTAAELGRSHNRWYVMQKVITMCSPHISENLANRLNIEIHVEGSQAKENLRICASRINLNLNSYHPEIIKAIQAE